MTDAPPDARLTARSPGRAGPAGDDTVWATIAHVGGVAGFLPALLVYLLSPGRGPLTRRESKEALNWQITFTIGYALLMVVAGLVAAVLILTSVGDFAGITWALPFALYLVNVVLSITAGLRVNRGGAYRYPFAIRLIK